MLNKRTKTKRVKKRSRNRASDGKRNIAGSRIRQIRQAASPKVTQEDLAGRLAAQGIHLDRTAVFRIEAGQRAVTDLELFAFARALRVRVAELFPHSQSL